MNSAQAAIHAGRARRTRCGWLALSGLVGRVGPPWEGNRAGVGLRTRAASADPDLLAWAVWVRDLPVRPLMPDDKANQFAPYSPEYVHSTNYVPTMVFTRNKRRRTSWVNALHTTETTARERDFAGGFGGGIVDQPMLAWAFQTGRCGGSASPADAGVNGRCSVGVAGCFIHPAARPRQIIWPGSRCSRCQPGACLALWWRQQSGAWFTKRGT